MFMNTQVFILSSCVAQLAYVQMPMLDSSAEIDQQEAASAANACSAEHSGDIHIAAQADKYASSEMVCDEVGHCIILGIARCLLK